VERYELAEEMASASDDFPQSTAALLLRVTRELPIVKLARYWE
jgi:hypothetical protein